MSQNLNPSTSGRPNYGATSSREINVPDVSFSPTEFIQLSANIAQNIRAVNSACIQLEKSLKSSKPINYAQNDIQKEMHSIHLKTKENIFSASRDLQKLSSIVTRGDKQQKLQLEKCKKDFGNVVEKYSEVQRLMATAMKQAIMTQSVRRAQTQNNSGIGGIDDERRSAEQQDLLESRRLEQMNLQFENSLLEDRERQLKEIENVVLDVNVIMSKMLALVHEQGEAVDHIEDRIEYSTAQVEQGRSELAKAADRRSHRRKVIIILIIAVIVGLIVTGIIVGNISK